MTTHKSVEDELESSLRAATDWTPFSYHQMWSAHWIHGAGKSGPRCYETHLHNVLNRHLCTCVGPDCPGSDAEPSSTWRTLIPTLSYGEDRDGHSEVLLHIY